MAARGKRNRRAIDSAHPPPETRNTEGETRVSEALVQFDSVGVTRSPGEAAALAGLTLSIASGEALALLGPPGAGKTLAMHLLAGFTRPGTGRVLLAGRSLVATPPHRRDLALVERDPALFPTMSVRDNVAFPLRLRGIDRRLREARAAEALAAFGLDARTPRDPRDLTPDQALRVALARALVFRPTLLLLDDPFADLGAVACDAVLADLRAAQRSHGMALLLATRAMDDALALADRIAVLIGGRLVQAGSPRAVYDEPASVAVARLTGAINLLPGVVLDREDNECRIRLDCGPVVSARAMDCGPPGSPCLLALRPERIAVAAMAAAELGDEAVPARLIEASFLGDRVRLRLGLGNGAEIIATRPAMGAALPAPGGPAAIAWPWSQALVFRPEA